jgi:hypothetical protein
MSKLAENNDKKGGIEHERNTIYHVFSAVHSKYVQK